MIIKIFGILHTTRIFTSLIIALIILLPAINSVDNLINSLLLSLNLFLTSMGGFALNDFFDFNKDKINKPHRPIPSNKITRNEALLISCLTLSLSLVLSIINTIFIQFGFLQIIFLVSMLFYNILTKHMAIAKTIYTALISFLVVFYPILINNLDNHYILLPISTLFFIAGRELLMDVLDLMGDKNSKMNTLPIYLGIKITSYFALVLLFVGSIISIPLFLNTHSYLGTLRLLIFISSIVLFYIIWLNGSTKLRRISIVYLWIPMIIALTTLVVE